MNFNIEAILHAGVTLYERIHLVMNFNIEAILHAGVTLYERIHLVLVRDSPWRDRVLYPTRTESDGLLSTRTESDGLLR